MTNYVWTQAISGDWTTVADWTPAGGPPGAADAATISAAGMAYTVAVTTADAVGALTLASANATLAVSGSLTVGGTFNVTAGTLAVPGTVTVNGYLTNAGAIDVTGAGAQFNFGAASTFNNQGLIDVAGGATVTIASAHFLNQTFGTLSGGVFEADAGSSFVIAESAAGYTIQTLNAKAILNGAGSNIQAQLLGGALYGVDSTLTAIGASGELDMLGGRNWTLNAAGVSNGGVIGLGGGAISPSGPSAFLTNLAGATLVGFGAVNVAINNLGTVEAKGGTLSLSNVVAGAGGLKVDSGATLAFTSPSWAETNNGLVTMAGGVLSSAGQPLTNGPTGRIVGYGNVTTPALLDQGTIEASGGTLALTTAVAGAGNLIVDGGASLTFDAGGAQGSQLSFTGTARFAGVNATLTLANLTAFQGTLGGFAAGDTIALPQLYNVNGAHATADDQLVLTSNGATVLTLKTDADYSSFNFLPVFAAQGTSFLALPKLPTVADFLAQKTLYDQTPGGFTLADTAANVLANLGALADIQINAIDVTGAVAVTAQTYVNNQYVLGKIAGGIGIADTLTNWLAWDWTNAPSWVNGFDIGAGFGAIRHGGVNRPLTLESGARLWVCENLTLDRLKLTAGASLGIYAGDTLTLTGGASLAGNVGGAGALDIEGGIVTIGDAEAMSAWTSHNATLEFDAANYFAGAFTATDDTLTLLNGRLALAGATHLTGVTVNGSDVVKLAGATTVIGGLTVGGTATLRNQSATTESGGDLTIGADANFVNAAGASWKFADDRGIAAAAGAGASINNAGLIEKTGGVGVSAIASALYNTGTLESASGTLALRAAVRGAGADVIDGKAGLEFDAGVAAGQTAAFHGDGGVLTLNDPLHFAGSIAGFAGADQIDLAGAWSVLGYQGGALTLGHGATHATLHFIGAYAASDFHAATAGGVTVLTY